MAKKSLTALRYELRNKEFKKFFDFAKANFDDCMQIKSNILTYPVWDDDGNEYFITATISVKVGSRDDNEAFDGYAEAESFKMKTAEKAEKARKAAEKKAEKIRKDEERRAKAKAAKEEREKEEKKNWAGNRSFSFNV